MLTAVKQQKMLLGPLVSLLLYACSVDPLDHRTSLSDLIGDIDVGSYAVETFGPAIQRQKL